MVGSDKSVEAAAANGNPDLTTNPLQEGVALSKPTTSKPSPAFRFYPGDFLSSTKVASMSMTERGVYITLLSHCWLSDGLPTDRGALARIVGMKLVQFQRMWDGPLCECFFERKGRLRNPRLDRERQSQDEYRAKQAANGAKGGRPKGLGYPRQTQEKPDSKARKSYSYSSSSSTSERTTEQERETASPPPSALMAMWNAIVQKPIPECRGLSAKRKTHAAARLAERPLPEWDDIIGRIQRSSFCRGGNDRGWVATFDWLIGSPDVALKVLEGKYDDRPAQVTTTSRDPQWLIDARARKAAANAGR